MYLYIYILCQYVYTYIYICPGPLNFAVDMEQLAQLPPNNPNNPNISPSCAASPLGYSTDNPNTNSPSNVSSGGSIVSTPSALSLSTRGQQSSPSSSSSSSSSSSGGRIKHMPPVKPIDSGGRISSSSISLAQGRENNKYRDKYTAGATEGEGRGGLDMTRDSSSRSPQSVGPRGRYVSLTNPDTSALFSRWTQTASLQDPSLSLSRPSVYTQRFRPRSDLTLQGIYICINIDGNNPDNCDNLLCMMWLSGLVQKGQVQYSPQSISRTQLGLLAKGFLMQVSNKFLFCIIGIHIHISVSLALSLLCNSPRYLNPRWVIH